jgi:hypothetical protein
MYIIHFCMYVLTTDVIDRPRDLDLDSRGSARLSDLAAQGLAPARSANINHEAGGRDTQSASRLMSRGERC